MSRLDNSLGVGLDNMAIAEAVEKQEIEEVLTTSVRMMNAKLINIICDKNIPKGAHIDLQYALRSGYLIHQFDDGELGDMLARLGYVVSYSVMGISGETVYAPPELPKPGSVTFVLDTSAGTSKTLIGAANWHWDNRVSVSPDMELPDGWRWKSATKYFVTALSISDDSKVLVKEAGCKTIDAEVISLPMSFYNKLDKLVPGKKLRAFLGSGGNIRFIDDLGDVFYGKKPQTLEEVEALADKFDYFTPSQRANFVKFHLKPEEPKGDLESYRALR
ncbi:hypothetical protein CVV38_04080 [Candidatus Peregrinibacteria bacterium HGW-Peregrinibacteria-1]|jgi:hypothetical protein|nr:MAG: hypothetical protein CVV38_04080 [Candidatus Peregrinibacteria bacterium HGW-Peregrinibacteria-1]